MVAQYTIYVVCGASVAVQPLAIFLGQLTFKKVTFLVIFHMFFKIIYTFVKISGQLQ